MISLLLLPISHSYITTGFYWKWEFFGKWREFGSQLTQKRLMLNWEFRKSQRRSEFPATYEVAAIYKVLPVNAFITTYGLTLEATDTGNSVMV
jgi:hypothetical protein